MPAKTAEQKLHDVYAKYKRLGGKKTKAQYAKHRGYSEGSGLNDAPPVDDDDDDVAIDLTVPAKDPMLHPTLTGKKGAPLPSPAAVPSKHNAGYEFKAIPRAINYKDIADS